MLSYKLTDYPVYNKLLNLLFCLIPFSLPFPMKGNNLLITVTVAVWLIGGNFKARYHALLHNRLFFLFSSLFFILILGLARNNNVSEGGPTVERALALILLPLVIFSSAPYTHQLTLKILKSFIAGCFVSMIICFIVAIYKHTQIDYAFEWNIFTIELNHVMDVSHPYYGMYLTFACFCAIYIYHQEKGKYSFISLCLFIALCILFMLAITSKLAFLGLVTITIFLGAKFADLRTHGKKIVWGSLIFIAFVFVIFKNVKHVERRFREGFHLSYDSIENNDLNYSSTRMGPLKCAIEVIRENWLWGVGTGDQDYMMTNCYYKNKLSKLTNYNSHNQYLDYWMTFGIGGIILFILCLAIPLKMAFEKKYLLYVSFLLLFILCNVTENMMNRNKGVVYYAFFNSLLACNLVSTKKQ